MINYHYLAFLATKLEDPRALFPPFRWKNFGHFVNATLFKKRDHLSTQH